MVRPRKRRWWPESCHRRPRAGGAMIGSHRGRVARPIERDGRGQSRGQCNRTLRRASERTTVHGGEHLCCFTFSRRGGLMKRFTLVVILAAAMVVSSIAAAHEKNYTVTMKTSTLTPPPEAIPNASGSLTVSIAGPIAVYRGATPSYHYETDFFVQVWGLAPSREYAFVFPRPAPGLRSRRLLRTPTAMGVRSVYPWRFRRPQTFLRNTPSSMLRRAWSSLSN